ncbi:SpoVT/AbrB domain-containing protein (plasmid) [Rhizobium sp. CCGE 510]|nr:SpoVT/AbrB domain-containing protein [Rhizobium sp. CCGE 510]
MPRLRHYETTPPREAKLFRNNKSQAVRIPADFELPGDRVMIHRDGDRLIIEPVRRKNLLDVLAGLQPLSPEDLFPDVDETLLPAKDIDLWPAFICWTPTSCPCSKPEGRCRSTHR